MIQGNQFDFHSSILVRIALTKNIYIFHKVVFMRERKGVTERERETEVERPKEGEREILHGVSKTVPHFICL